MTQFQENNPKQLKKFIDQINNLVEEFHPNIYLIDGVFKGINEINEAIIKQLQNENNTQNKRVY